MAERQTSSPPVAPDGNANAPKTWQWVLLICLVGLLVGATLYAKFGFDIEWTELHRTLPRMIADMGMWGQLLIIGLMIVHCFVPFPAEFVAVAAGSAYGTLYGTFLTWTGAMLGAMLSFVLTRLFGQPFVEWVLPTRQKKHLDRWVEDQGAFTLLVSRFIPVIAFNLINYAAGLTKIGWWTFFWTTGIGILPLTTLMVYMGATMHTLSWQILLFVSAICIAAMALLHYGSRRFRKP